MNASNRCASCSAADVSSMRGAEPCALPGLGWGGCQPCCPLVTPLSSPLVTPLPAAPPPAAGFLSPRGAEEERGAGGAG